MFEDYPDVVDVDDLCKMLGGISRKLAYRLLNNQDIKSVRIGRSQTVDKVPIGSEETFYGYFYEV